MNKLRLLLFPFAILYGLITDIRNTMYFANILKRTSFEKPIITVGNLSVGGTGKTPFVEYLLRLLESNYQTATLSRGYKRQSSGFQLANQNTTMQDIGDEPFQYHSKFKNTKVAVDANRVNGISRLLESYPNLDVIILDDAYQHLAVKAGLNILLTNYFELYSQDFMLPAGNLRETRKGANRADIIIVSKCPENLSELDQQRIRKSLNLKAHQSLFFTYIKYSSQIVSNSDTLNINQINLNEVLLVAGIAKPKNFFDFLKTDNTVCLSYPDHHNFTESDLNHILTQAQGKKIITTEKDFVRLNNQLPSNQLYYLPIKTSFIKDQERMDQIIIDYVGQDSRNHRVCKPENI